MYGVHILHMAYMISFVIKLQHTRLTSFGSWWSLHNMEKYLCMLNIGFQRNYFIYMIWLCKYAILSMRVHMVSTQHTCVDR